MKYILAIGLLLTGKSIHAQKNIDGMVNAEKSFAAYSVEHGTKPAFLKFLDSAGIVFDQGKPVSGIESWNKKDNRPGILNWHPDFAEISASNDFGFTTGPWTFQPTLNDTIVARGRFITVWHADQKGNWKFLIDLGVSNTPPNNLELKTAGTNRFKAATHESVLKVEKKFVERTSEAFSKHKSRTAWYMNFCSDENLYLNRHNHRPATNKTEDLISIMQSMPSSIKYKITGSGISPAGDLGYIYGTTEIAGKTEGYLRIWRREGRNWKIAVEVLRY